MIYSKHYMASAVTGLSVTGSATAILLSCVAVWLCACDRGAGKTCLCCELGVGVRDAV